MKTPQQKIVKKLEKIADKFSAEELKIVIEQVYGVEIPNVQARSCPTGYTWSPSLERCLADPIS